MDPIFFVLLFVLFSLLLYVKVVVALKFKLISIQKGYDNKNLHVFTMCFFLGIVGYLYVIALPDLKKEERLLRSIKTLEKAQSE